MHREARLSTDTAPRNGARARTVILAAALASICLPAAAAQELTTIFNGTAAISGGQRRQVVAVAVGAAFDVAALIDELRPYAGSNLTLLAYSDHESVSETEPVVVFVDGELARSLARPRRSTVPPTIAESTARATTIQRGSRIGAICSDGSRTTAIHSGACQFRGGVADWLYTAVATTHGNTVVSAICRDYRLVVGSGDRCGSVDVLAQVKAVSYPAPTPAPAPETRPSTGVPVAPLPDPSRVLPVIDRSDVAWTQRMNGEVGFSWSASVSNPSALPIRALVMVRLRGADGSIIHSAEHAVDLEGRAKAEFTDSGTVTEDEALAADRWTFDVAIAEDAADEPAGEGEPVQVALSVDLQGEEVQLTNTGDRPIDLNGWSLVSQVGGETFTFRFFKLGAGKTVVLSSGASARSVLPEVYLWTTREIWDDAGDTAELRDPEGRVRARSNPGGS